MPRFEPFAAIRYNRSRVDLERVAAPPYDVLLDADLDDLASRDPHNIVHIDVPREAQGAARYDDAATRLQAWLTEGVMERDQEASYTLYRMAFTTESGQRRETVGVVGGLEVVDEGAGGVLPHERTTPKAKTDRLDLTRSTHCNLSPVWGLSLASGLSGLLLEPGEPMGEVTVDGVTHTVERVADPARVDAIRSAIAAQPIVIADGHHRYAISRTFRDEIRAASGSTSTDAELTMTYVAELVADQLSIDAIHRLYHDVEPDALLAHLADYFDLTPAGPVMPSFTDDMARTGTLCFVHGDGHGTWLTPKPDRFAGVRDLDGARLEHALAEMPHSVTYQHGVALVVGEVVAGRARAAVLIRPTGIDEIRRTADEGLLMPPKSTFFTPKLRTGLVIRPLDGLERSSVAG